MISEKAREILRIALKEGGEVLRQVAGNKVQARLKENLSSVVTDADLASEQRILEILTGTGFPCNIISEEAGFLDHGSEYTWVVDPLDGTSNFAAGLPWYGVIIALFRTEEPILAGMYLPHEDQLYWAESGKGALRNDHPVRTSRSRHLEQQLISYSFDYTGDPDKIRNELRLMEQLSARVRNVRSTNSLYDFCYVADGRLGAALNQTTRIWDIAAAALILKEAGGVVTDTRGKPIRFDLSGNTFQRNYTIVAAGAGLHHALMKILLPT
jgi:myo-inositol-1(or 4)-monophosphatase